MMCVMVLHDVMTKSNDTRAVQCLIDIDKCFLTCSVDIDRSSFV